MEIVPRNVFERCYALCVILLALVAFSSFISSITSSMTHLRSMNVERKRQEELIRRYITQNKLSLDLGTRIQTFLRQKGLAENSKRRVHEKHILVFGMLPEIILVELRTQVFKPTIEVHPFFRKIDLHDESGLVAVCSRCLTEQALVPSQELFTEIDVCKKMYVILSGDLEYLAELQSAVFRKVASSEYACEMCLWCQWEHQGRLAAVTTCEIVEVDAKQFRSLASGTMSFESWKKYAQQYVQCLTQVIDDDFIPSDLWRVTDADERIVEKAFAELQDLLRAQSETPLGNESASISSMGSFFRNTFSSISAISRSSSRVSITSSTGIFAAMTSRASRGPLLR